MKQYSLQQLPVALELMHVQELVQVYLVSPKVYLSIDTRQEKLGSALVCSVDLQQSRGEVWQEHVLTLSSKKAQIFEWALI